MIDLVLAGSLDYETEDASAFASWGVDYLKYDNCYHMGRFGTPQASFNRYNAMSKALNATGRSILLGLCSWGEDYVHTWGMSIANSWRMSGDIYDSFVRPDALCSCNEPSDPHCIAPGMLWNTCYMEDANDNRNSLFCAEYYQPSICICRPCSARWLERLGHVGSWERWYDG